jgi:predicted Zn-dependent protease
MTIARGRLGPFAAAMASAVLALACDVSTAQEDELGDQFAASIKSQIRLLEDSSANAWLSRLGNRLAGVADTESRDWHFYLVDDTTVNAFAVPGGHIFVHRGLIEYAGSYSELAGVLGHEVAHITLRHSVDQMKSRTRTGLVVTVICAVINVCNSTAGQIVIDAGGQALFAKYSRDHEAQADSAAVGYLVQARIDPRGIPLMFKRMAALRTASPGALESWLGSHPLEGDRGARTDALIAKIGPTGMDELVASDSDFASFQQAVRQLGPDR